MLPAQRNKIDINSLNPEERKLFSLYGRLPSHKNVLSKMQKGDRRKYFDSGDYALSKAGVAPQTTVGTAIPNPQNIPHSSQTNSHNSLSVSPTNSSSPVKESALSHDPQADDGPPNDTAVDDADAANIENDTPVDDSSVDDTPLRHADASEAETT